MASLTREVSEIINPLDSLDTESCVSVCRALGAEIGCNAKDRTVDHSTFNRWTVNGKNFLKAPAKCDVGNSGTTLFLALAAAGLGTHQQKFIGDEQIQKRSASPLLEALEKFGIETVSARNGCAPISVKGPWKGGSAVIPCPTSQYLSALLLAAPLAPTGTVTEIIVPLLNEKPYVEMTLSYLKSQKIPFDKKNDLSYFRIPGGSSYAPINGPVYGDFSSAAFPMAAAAITGGKLTLQGLDPNDTQGDKQFIKFLEKMGRRLQWKETTPADSCYASTEWELEISGNNALAGGVFDLNSTPDLLPLMAVMGSFAQGETILENAASARIKETDRITVMACELAKLGVNCRERPDGLIILGNPELKSFEPGTSKIKLESHGDHRIAMALAVCALALKGRTEITDAECASVTYPDFWEMMNAEIGLV